MSLLTAQDAYRLQRDEGWNTLDVRSPLEYAKGHIKGAMNVPFTENDGTPNESFLQQMLVRFKKEDKLIVYCSSGRHSSHAVVRLAAAGFKNLADLFGGHQQWVKNHLPINSSNDRKNV